MTRPTVAVTNRIAVASGGERLRARATVLYWDGAGTPSREQLADLCRHADALVCTPSDLVDARLLQQAPGLRVISNFGVGYDHIDVHAATQRSIPIGFTPDVVTEATADLAWGLILAASRRIAEADRYVRAGQWTRVAYDILLGDDAYGATLGIVGYGQIGRAVARRAAGFAMTVLHHSRSRAEVSPSRWVELDELLQKSDIVTIHTSLNPSTYGLIGARELSLMKPSAVLVNTSRGPVVDNTALAHALSTGLIRGAALDVTHSEPIRLDDPLLSLPNCIVTPHIASASRGARRAMSKLVVANVLAGLEGRPMPHCVNPGVS